MDFTGMLDNIKQNTADNIAPDDGKTYALTRFKMECNLIDKKKQGHCYCQKCGDTKLIPTVRYYADMNKYYFGFERCNCINAEAVKLAIAESGLEREISIKTFATFRTDNEFQKVIKAKAVEYLKEVKQNKKPWFYAGGQTGAGKSHICIAIANRFLQNNYKLKYMRWVDELRLIKSNFNSSKLQEFKECDVLYIDDLFKGTKNPSEYDVGIAFELINYRDSNNLITIISSEMTDGELKAVDEAIHGRIKAHATDRFMISIKADESKNYRVKGENMDLFGGM